MDPLIRDITAIPRCGTQCRTDNLAQMGLKFCHTSYLMKEKTAAWMEET
ncbi:MAG: hypothetical protein ACI4PO_02350 [Faecousia sp.]